LTRTGAAGVADKPAEHVLNAETVLTATMADFRKALFISLDVSFYAV
jgi:hypothetical protein